MASTSQYFVAHQNSPNALNLAENLSLSKPFQSSEDCSKHLSLVG